MNIELGNGWYFFALFIGRVDGWCLTGKTVGKKYWILEIAIGRPKWGLQKVVIFTK